MRKTKILIVEDEEDILELIQFNLWKEGYEAKGVMSGEQAFEEAAAFKPDLILLDIMLPKINGLDVCRKLKNDPLFKKVPIILITAKGEEEDIVSGFEAGGDDYITKPFSPKVLCARVKAVLRREIKDKKESPDIRYDKLIISPLRYEVLVEGNPIKLTHTEFRLLLLLAEKAGYVFTRDQVIDNLYGGGYYVTDRSVDVQVAGLRQKLGPAGFYIETVRGVGYKFKE